MVAFYNAADQELYKKYKFLPQEKYRLGLTLPTDPVADPVAPETIAPVPGGITNTNAFNNSGNDFQNNTNVLGLRTPGSDFASSGSYITNRTNSGSMLPGAEKEDNFLQKILKAGGRGIASMIPGAGMFTSVADKFDRFDDLNPLDQEFINSQMSGYEQNIHGTQNLPQQDRYGYNKRSALGNYSELIDKRVKIAEDFYAKKGYYRPIDEYYMDKSKDKNTIQSQMDMNDKVRNHIINQKAQSGPAINNPFSEDYSGNTQSPNYTPTGPNQPDPTPTNNGGRDPNQGNTQTGYGKSGMGRDPDDKMAKGGRAGYFFGGRVNYKTGGRTGYFLGGNIEGGYSESQKDSGGKQTTTSYSGGDNDGGASDNPPPTFYDNGVQVITDQSKFGFNYPTGLTKNLGVGQLTAILDARKSLEEEEPEGMIQYDSSVGPINTKMSYDSTTGPEFNANYIGDNLNANYNTKTGLGVNYSKDIGPGTFTMAGTYNPDGTYNAEAKYGISFANGGLASIL